MIHDVGHEKIVIITRPWKAVLIATGGMWLLVSLGVFIVVHTGRWMSLFTGSQPAAVIQLAGFYVAFFAGHLPGVVWVAFSFSRSTVRNPVFMAALVTAVSELLRFAIFIIRSPWQSATQIDSWLPATLDLAGILLLTLLASIITSMMRKADKP